MRLDKAWLQLQCSLIGRCGFVEFPLDMPGVSQVIVRLGPIGPVRQSTPEALHAGVMFAALTCGDPQQVPRIVVMRVSRENLAVNWLRLAQPARLVVLQRDSQCFRNCGHASCSKEMESSER